MSKAKNSIDEPKTATRNSRNGRRTLQGCGSMFGTRDDGEKMVKASVAELDNGGYPVSLSLIISRLLRNHPEIDLKHYSHFSVKQAVYKFVKKLDVKLTGPEIW